jgi:hypothetical protein
VVVDGRFRETEFVSDHLQRRAAEADITVTGTHTGYLTGDVNINKLTRTITSTNPANPTPITSSLDGDKQVLLDPADIADARANV